MVEEKYVKEKGEVEAVYHIIKLLLVKSTAEQRSSRFPEMEGTFVILRKIRTSTMPESTFIGCLRKAKLKC